MSTAPPKRPTYRGALLGIMAAVVVAIILSFREVAGPAAWIARLVLPILVLAGLLIAVAGITGRRSHHP